MTDKIFSFAITDGLPLPQSGKIDVNVTIKNKRDERDIIRDIKYEFINLSWYKKRDRLNSLLNELCTPEQVFNFKTGHWENI